MKWDNEQLERFWSFIAERQSVFHKRKVLRLPPPWSEEEVFSAHHFTNVYRELDPGTIWIRRNVLEKKDLEGWEKGFLVLAYRLFGTPAIFESLGFSMFSTPAWMLPDQFDALQLEEELEGIIARGESAFTKAYMVAAYGDPGSRKTSTVSRILEGVSRGWLDTWTEIEASASRKEAHSHLTSPWGIGDFIGFQAMVDLCYPNPLGKLLNFSNDDWIRGGPGCLRGIGILRGMADCTKFRVGPNDADNAACAELVSIQEESLYSLGMRWLLNERSKPIRLDRSNIQNCLCEFSKYHKLTAGVQPGRIRRFAPEEAALRDEVEGSFRCSLSGAAVQTDLEDWL